MKQDFCIKYLINISKNWVINAFVTVYEKRNTSSTKKLKIEILTPLFGRYFYEHVDL